MDKQSSKKSQDVSKKSKANKEVKEAERVLKSAFYNKGISDNRQKEAIRDLAKGTNPQDVAKKHFEQWGQDVVYDNSLINHMKEAQKLLKAEHQ